MAHFAELDTNNVVLRVIVVNNSDTCDENGVESESIGIAFCQKLFGGTWIQTSYNNKFRKRYAAIGYTYDANLDAFIRAKPFPSWVFNLDTLDWDPPVPMPTEGGPYIWDEGTTSWVTPPSRAS
jgi:hypothetical protein